MEQFSSMFILELKPSLLFLLSGSLCVFSLLPTLPLPLSPWNTSYYLQREQREGLYTFWNGFYLLIRWRYWEYYLNLGKTASNSLSCQEAAILWKGGLTWESLAQGWSSQRGPMLPQAGQGRLRSVFRVPQIPRKAGNAADRGTRGEM